MTGARWSERIDELIASMTLAEKIGQMTLITAHLAVTGPKVSDDIVGAVRAGDVGTILHLWGAQATREMQRVAVEETRLGVPLLFAADVIHGHRTLFPIPLAEAAAFDPDLWQRTARAAAAEAAADGLMLNFAPMIDVARDPRWGRIAESPGEDPWLGARFAEAKVRGFQGQDLAAADTVAATAKHFAGYGAVMAGREYATVEISERTVHEVYLPPFRAAVAAGAAGIMPSFTDLGGVPLSAHVPLLRGLLREQWGFDGVIVSDFNAITELITHGVAGDVAEAAALALIAGIDIDLMGHAYARGLPDALERGRVTTADVDAAVRRILSLKADLGLFDDPYRRSQDDALVRRHQETNRELARDCARRSIVLLTNRGDLLPLDDAPRRLAVIGPLADAAAEMRGPWSIYAKTEPMVPILDGVRAAFPGCEVRHAAGVGIADEGPGDIAAALDVARAADVVLLCLGEAERMSGEAASRARPGLPGRQGELAKAVLDLDKPVVVVLSSGRPILVPWLFERADAVLATWFLGSEAGHAVGDVLTGRFNPSARLPVTWPVEVGQVPIYYGQPPTGRPPDPDVHYSGKYIDMPVEPLFPFGHGLSYARFELGAPRTSAGELRAGERMTVEVDVANQGPVAGEETLLLFAHDPVASITRPVLELKGTAKVTLAPGEQGTARFTLAADELAFPGPDLTPRLEPGTIELYVGRTADRRSLLQTTIRIRD